MITCAEFREQHNATCGQGVFPWELPPAVLDAQAEHYSNCPDCKAWIATRLGPVQPLPHALDLLVTLEAAKSDIRNIIKRNKDQQKDK
jgi:hypothetical protein